MSLTPEQRRERTRFNFEVVSYAALIVSSIVAVAIALRPSAPAPERPRKPAEEKVIIEVEPAIGPNGIQGWSQEAVDAMRDWTDQQQQFRVISKATGAPSTRDNSKSNVRLWKLTALNVANPPPNGPQLTGDCTSWSSCHAIEDTQSAHAALADPGNWGRAFPPWLYGAGRQWIWKKQILGPLPAEGCSVGANARAAMEFGVLSWEEARQAGYEYSGEQADLWGSIGPPEKLKAIAARHKLGGASPMKDSTDCMNALCNGYGIASGGDFTPPLDARGNATFRQADGRLVADNAALRMRWDSRWHHALAIDGYDGTGSVAYFHIQNSWFPQSHPSPIDDSPPCGFWVTAETVDYMCKGCTMPDGRRCPDTWAFCDFEGFVERAPAVDLFSIPDSDVPSLLPKDDEPAASPAAPSKTQVAP